MIRQQTIAGWGNYKPQPCRVTRPHTLEALGRAVACADARTVIARGLGRSYGDAAINPPGHTVETTALNRMRAFDESTGVLCADAGVSLGEVVAHLLPRGWFLPTTPGTRFVTLGGAVAADVHGKNHHRDGSFGKAVKRVELLLADGRVVNASRTENAELFRATLGGMGLAGMITAVELQLRRTETAYCDVTYRRASGLARALELMEQTNADYRHSVAWIDCLARGAALGRCVLMLGNDAAVDDLPEHHRHRPLQPPRRRSKNVPFDFPPCVLGPTTVRAFNKLYYARHGDARKVVDFDTFFYPLDSIGHWNRIYGKRGFIQYQALLPPDQAHDGLVELLEAIGEAQLGSFLAVLKKSGESGEGLMSYMFPGYTLALDLPNTGAPLERLVDKLDHILLNRNGRLYLAKDATTRPDTLAAMYPNLDRLRQVKATYDPNHRFVSAQARRLGIVEDA